MAIDSKAAGRRSGEIMKVLVCNVGSTSLKFKLFDMPAESLIVEAKIERVGSKENATYEYRNHATNSEIKKEGKSVPKYSDGINMFLTSLLDPTFGALGTIDEIAVIGFKTVLAKNYNGVHELDDDVLRAMEEYLFVAPAHNGPYIEAIKMFRSLLPDTLLVGVFETAFHTTIPIEHRLYSIPYEWYQKYGIQKMGYHGASHSFIAKAIEQDTQAPAGYIISCHLGGSCSICAISDGKSVDNSFGFSLQTGIPHANRSGDLDSYIVPFLLNQGLKLDEIIQGMSKGGGMLGLSGVDRDMREIVAAAERGNKRAALAIDVFVCSIIRYIGSYYAELGGLDHLVFTGGIGENSSLIRGKVCGSLKHMGVVLDAELNASAKGKSVISAEGSKVKIHIIPTNEEIDIARKTYALLMDTTASAKKERC
jgi:acetate kinase